MQAGRELRRAVTERIQQEQRAEQAQARLDALGAQREELQSQQGQLLRRRNQLDEQRHISNGAARQEIEGRIREIDVRTAQIDAELLQVNARIAEQMAARTAAASAQDGPQVITIPRIDVPQISIPPIQAFPSQRGLDGEDVAAMMAGQALVLLMLGAVVWRFAMRRMRANIERAIGDQGTRLAQLQQAVDVIGVEVERISEGQRYVAKVLTEGTPAGAAVLPSARQDARR
jgi:hypothetical protein